MTDSAPVPTAGDMVSPPEADPLDNPEVRKAIVDGVKQIAELEADRRELNAQIRAIREGWAARGLNAPACQAAEKFYKLDEPKRDGWDRTYAVARGALSVPFQATLFGDPAEGEPASTNAAGAPEKPKRGRRRNRNGDGDGVTGAEPGAVH